MARRTAANIAKLPDMSYTGLVVSGDGEHHNAADATLGFLGNRGCMDSLRLHSHAETAKKATNFARSDAGRTATWLFCSRRRKGW